jgi:mono/diheme cytochrome c family protein
MAIRGLGFALFALPLLCPAAPSDFFEQRIRPLFVKRCQGCHPIAKLSSAAVVPGKPEASLLYQAVARTHATLQMPPTGKLPDAEIADLARWITEGAIVPTAPAPGNPSAWAFTPLPQPAPVSIDAQLAKL